MKISEILEPGQQQPIENELSRLQDERNRLRDRAEQLSDELMHQYDQDKHDELKDIKNKLYDNEVQLHSVQSMGPDDKVWRMLKTQCSEFLEVLKSPPGLMLLRGIRGENSAVFQGRGWANRRSKDSTPRVSMVFNYCLEKLGFAARRDNSTFVTTNKNLAKEFGQIYLIFPKNGFKFTYTSGDDMVLDESSMSSCVDDAEIQKTARWLTKLKRNSQSLVQAIFASTFNDAMARRGFVTTYQFMEKIMAFKPEYVEQFHKETGVNMDWRRFVDLKKFTDTYRPNKHDILSAIHDRREIYILGEYIALDAMVFKKTSILNAIENYL
ncbi:hypothetical protein UFOVP29_351 [uncultured Caudovirales phage]|uniref:Uncharacterized protein n=1 Tax=uncultured Caudovirales phage TaxID=2100421 RepID=A0A6J5KPU4_9CAUD|nr:hypothetical protein UFOVP29_351 [uncultured Caudovirales phage]